MTKNESRARLGSTSSEQTDDSARSDATLALGRKLVAELGLEPSVDTLGRWMAHHIADLLTRVEGAKGKAKDAAKRECFDAVLALWGHRAELPNRSRPFGDLEPVIRAIESLDPDDQTPRYFRAARLRVEGEPKTESTKWLDLADSLDYSARILIGVCLAEAARAAIDKGSEWVKLAEAAGAEDGAPEVVFRFTASTSALGRTRDPNAQVRRKLEERLGKLRGFIELAQTVAADLAIRLEALQPPSGNDAMIADDLPS